MAGANDVLITATLAVYIEAALDTAIKKQTEPPHKPQTDVTSSTSGGKSIRIGEQLCALGS